MERWHLTQGQKEKLMAWSIVLVGALVMFGQVIDAQSTSESDWVTSLRTYIDPVQYMVGMLVINFILVSAAIKKYKQIPNPFLNILKWNFAILFINDFVVLLLRVTQNNNIIALKGSLAMGMGKTYLIMATIRSLTDLTFNAAAILLLSYGLSRYAPLHMLAPGKVTNVGKTVCWLVVLQWVVSIPVSFSAFISSRLLFSLALGLSQFGQLAVVAIIYWIVKENYQKYHTKFFRYLTNYYAITLFVTGLVFTYSLGSFGVLQRFPAGEVAVFSGFSSVVFYSSRLAYIILNYLMFQAVANYREAGPALQNPGQTVDGIAVN